MDSHSEKQELRALNLSKLQAALAQMMKSTADHTRLSATLIHLYWHLS